VLTLIVIKVWNLSWSLEETPTLSVTTEDGLHTFWQMAKKDHEKGTHVWQKVEI